MVAGVATTTVDYVYDYNNLLIQRTEGTDVTVFVNHNDQTVLELDAADDSVTARYLWDTVVSNRRRNHLNELLRPHRPSQFSS